MKKEKNVIDITTPSGFTCVLDRDKFDDWRFVEILGSGDGLSDYKMCVFVVNNGLSPEDADRLKEMCKKPDGTISGTKMQNIIAEIMTAIGEQAKN